MEYEFWNRKWQRGQLGFHLNEVNPILKKYGQLLLDHSQKTVLAPLSGKSLDLLWLGEKYQKVIGLEFVQQARPSHGLPQCPRIQSSQTLSLLLQTSLQVRCTHVRM